MDASVFVWLWTKTERPESGWIFPSTTHPDRHMNVNNWYHRRWRPAIITAGLDALKMNFHTLRHTWATRAGQETASRILQSLGGWSDIRQVERYCRATMPAMRQAMERGVAVNPKNFIPTAAALPQTDGEAVGDNGKV